MVNGNGDERAQDLEYKELEYEKLASPPGPHFST